MADNPFQTPQQHFKPQGFTTAGSRAPAALNVILIFSIIIGSLGFLGSCFGGLGMVANIFINNLQPNIDPNDAGVKLQRQIQEANQPFVIPNFIMVGLNLLIAPLMLVGAIGCLNRKAWAHRVLTMSLIAAIIFILIRMVVGVISQIKLKSVLGDGMVEAMKPAGEMQFFGAIFGGVFWLMVVLGVLWVLALAGFYGWSYMYLNKPESKSYLGVE